MGLSGFNAMRARLAAQEKALVQEVEAIEEVVEPTSPVGNDGEVDVLPQEEVAETLEQEEQEEVAETDAEKIKRNKNRNKKGN